MTVQEPLYRSLSSVLKERFGAPVRKISLDAGLGCPNREPSLGRFGCIYCNPRGSGTGAHARGVSIRDQVDEGIRRVSARYRCHRFVAYFQSFTNTYGDLALLERIYSEALSRPEMVGLAVGTRPDCAPDSVLDLLAGLGRDRMVWVEYGLQSIHESSLRLIHRGHGPEAFLDAVVRTRERGIGVVAHLILGLPGETVEDMVATARAVAEARVDGVKLHPLYVIEGTELAEMFRTGRYRPMSEEEAIQATVAVLDALPERTVIHRLTSDPHPEELVAPSWMLDRKGVRMRLEEALRRRKLEEG